MITPEYAANYQATMQRKLGSTERPGPNLVSSATGAKIGIFRMEAPLEGMDDIINVGIAGVFGVGTIALSLDQARTLRAILDHELESGVE